ncbi:hypothetical protein DFH07DRAFT_409631 [Mycena maculata]|uniref:DUF6534 domain-containing protein n=1 Tax=Mycena maculata TaxID=230809 RepID=A0AAD7NIZ0_9AGAR|nr:hypothetical protein DFH07DRAFT_409631 [Mycena maculata]
MSFTTEAPNIVTPLVPNYAHIVSPFLIGALLNFFFFGTLLVQVYVYRVCFPKDRLGFKFLVYFILLAMTACICLNAADIEYWFGTGFGQIQRFTDSRNVGFYVPLMGSFIAMLVQIFFCYRIVVIRRAAWPLAFLIALISMAQCAGGMGSGILGYMDPNMTDEVLGTNLFPLHDNKHTILAYLWLIGDAVADVLIAITMTFLLLKADVVPATREIVHKVTTLVVETNIFSAIIAVLSLLLFVGIPDTSYFACPTFILSGIYANTLLLSLNNRATSKEDSVPASSHYGATPSVSVAGRDRQQAPVYSASSRGRMLSVPAMSFARRSEEEEKTPRARSSIENKWRDDPESESEYGGDAEDRV